MSYFTDQLMTPYSKYFSSGSTINGTPGRDRRVLGGQIGRLSWPLHRLDTKRSESTKLKMNLAPPKIHHEIQSSPATTTTSKRLATQHVPRVSTYSPASVDPGFMEMGLVQLSSVVKMTNVTHTHIQTDKLKIGTLYAPRYEKAFFPEGKKRPRSLRSLSLTNH